MALDVKSPYDCRIFLCEPPQKAIDDRGLNGCTSVEAAFSAWPGPDRPLTELGCTNGCLTQRLQANPYKSLTLVHQFARVTKTLQIAVFLVRVSPASDIATCLVDCRG
jgi:hypothetical protein